MKRTTLHVVRYGPDTLLLRVSAPGDLPTFALQQALLTEVDRHPPLGLLEATPGFATLALEFGPGMCPDPEVLRERFQSVVSAVDLSAPLPPVTRRHEVPVVYDGPDLERVAAQSRLKVDEVVQIHAAAEYRVHLLGFAPGFPYLTGLDPRLHTPRLESPRPRIEAGSVAIGGSHAGIYPLATAGGWNVLGRTSVALIDPAGLAAGVARAFLLQPGDAVHFHPVAKP